MRDFLVAVAVFATIAISTAVDQECIERKMRGLPVHWPNPIDCASFYRCTNKNIKRELLCPDGKLYNPKNGRCSKQERSLCRLSLAAPLTKGINNNCADKLSGTFMPDPTSCRGFNICNNNISYPQTCDAGSYFNTEISACEPDTKLLCWENLCMNKTNGVFVSNEKDCHSFYVCNNEYPTSQNCPDGSFFNRDNLTCQPGKCETEETTTTTVVTTTEITTTLAPTTIYTTETTTVTYTTPKTTTTTCAAVTTTCTTEATTTSCGPEITTTTCKPETTTTTCEPETTTTTCKTETTTTTCVAETTTTTCDAETTTTTCAPETTTTPCKLETTTTKCAPETTTTCAPETTTTTCAAETTTTTCEPETTTTTCGPETTTTTCVSAKTTTTTCSPQETTTSAITDCENTKCDSSKCQHATDTFVFPAESTNAGFCVCLDHKVEFRTCPDEAIFIESLLICMTEENVCPSSNCLNQPEYTTYPAANTTNGFCKCLHGRASFFECDDNNNIYNSNLGFLEQSAERPTNKLCKGIHSEGDFVAKADNCMTFYICYEDELVEVSCEAGNYFDESNKACLPDRERKCADSQQPAAYSNSIRRKRSIRSSNCVEGAKTPASDCDKYYKCSSGHRLLYGCGKDYFFNVTTLECQLDVENVCWPVNSCTEGEKNPYPDDNTKYYECTNGKIEIKCCGPDSYFNKLKRSCVAKEECTCPGGYKDGEISAHPTDCDKFYICINSEQIWHECGKGNYFDKKTLSCKKDVENTCHIEEPCLCPGGYEDGEMSAHPNDCHHYYICVNGQQILHDCGEDNYFDNNTLACQRDIYNECWHKKDCTCPGGYEEGQFSAHPLECNKYYICHDSRQVLQDCGTNNYFNNDTLSCKPDVYHVCWPNLCAGQPNGALVANPQQCNAFFLCSNNEPAAKACSEGQWFDPNLSACTADVNAVCYNPCADEAAGKVVLLPHPICNQYYFCNNRKTFVGTCLVGSFDNTTGVCNEAKKCFPNPCDNPEVEVYPDAYDPSKFYWCNKDHQPIPYTCPSGMEFDVIYKICRKMSNPDCPVCKTDGAFPTLDDTIDTEFCVCVDGVSTKFECPNEYVFNTELGVCYSNAPCDPSFCLTAPEYAISPNRNCSRSFCMCFDKRPVIIACPNNGNFNPYTLECSNYTMSPECLQATCIGETNNNHVFKPIDPKKSNGFCQCINQIATFKPCRYGSTFNPDLLICQLDEINCNSYQCRGLPDNTIIPAVTTTDGYCECVDGVATYHNCPNNGEFNITSNKCEAALCDLSKCGEIGANNPFAASVSNGFCMCNLGFVECQPKGTLYSETFGNCMDPCPQVVCSGKPDKYLVSSLINKNSFCVCHTTPTIGATYELCPSGPFVFNEAEQMCVGNVEVFTKNSSYELCGKELCKVPGAFEANNTLTGFCLCTDKGEKPKFHQCLEGIFVPDKMACLPRAEDVCDVSLCCHATIEHPITLPANNSALEFCYCSSPTDAMLLLCPNGKYYNAEKGMCVNEFENNCSCPDNVAQGEKVPDTAACNKYYVCIGGVMESFTCPDGDYFNVDVNCCVPDTEGVCAKTSECTCLGIYYENERLPHPVNTQMYYMCQGNALHEYECPMGRFFSVSQKQCIPNTNLRQKRSADLSNDHEFDCLENEKRSVPSNCSQYEICEQQIWKRQTCSNYNYYNPEQRKCLEPHDDFVCSYARVSTLPICNTSMEHYLLKSKNCQQYYRCESGKWRLISCGRKKYFNAQISSCLPIPHEPPVKCELLEDYSSREAINETETTLESTFLW